MERTRSFICGWFGFYDGADRASVPRITSSYRKRLPLLVLRRRRRSSDDIVYRGDQSIESLVGMLLRFCKLGDFFAQIFLNPLLCLGQSGNLIDNIGESLFRFQLCFGHTPNAII